MSETMWDRLAAKTAEQILVQELVNGFELAPRTAQGILETVKSVLLPATSSLRAGQVRLVAAVASARHGRVVSDLDKQEITLTVDAGTEDAAVIQEHGPAALRQVRILRLTDEAVEQGCLLTEEDLAWTLHVDVRTVRRDIQNLRQTGYVIRTRGYQHNIGRGQTHKVMIVERYLKRQGLYEIARETKHSVDAVRRYVVTFGRVVYLHRRPTNRNEIAFLVGISESTVQQYLDLYVQYDRPEYAERLAEIVAPPTDRPYLPMGKKGAWR
jgi:DNA-binding transcriptional regulator YhcF (GntR family)